jgi:hypothetical protein
MLSVQAILGLSLVSVALVGGGIATYHNIRETRGPRERRFVWRICVAAWALVLSMLFLMYVLPSPYRYVTFFVYFVVTPWLIYRWTNTHQLIRILEQRERDEPVRR